MKILKGGVWCVWIGLLLQVSLSYGANSGRDAAREQKYEDELRQLDPSSVEPFRRANDAFDAEKYDDAATLYRAVHEAAPTFDPALRRLGSALCLSGNRSDGLRISRQAVALHRSEANLSSLAYNLAGIRAHGASSKEDRREAIQLLRESRALRGTPDFSDLLVQAELTLQSDDRAELPEVVGELQKNFPDTLQTHYFAAISAATKENWVTAEREIKKAQLLGLPEKAADEFLDSGIGTRATAWKVAYLVGGVIGLWLLGLALLFALGFLLSRLTLRSAEKADPNVAITTTELRMRRVYRAVVNAAGFYYYLSLPIVMLMVLGACAAVIFLFLAIGWMPIKLTAILVIGAIITVISMVRSLFLKVSAEDPGRPLKREEAPGLWTLAEDVARQLGTRPVDEIRITTGTDMAVYERGNWREKIRDKAQRILLVGTGVLNGFRQSDFRSVLAHEYGHFSHRDTAGGEVALRVRTDMLKFYLTMVRAGQATYLNLAFHFLRAYNLVFRRISHGATRLQEILADRFAAQAYGAASFENGLKHVIRRGLEFSQVADHEIGQVIKSKQPLLNLYEATAADGASLEKAYEKAIQRPTTDDDTHPSPTDRFRLISAVRTPDVQPLSGEVWDLFTDREAIKREMLARVEKQIAQYRT